MEKEFTLKSELVRDDVDRQMVYLVRRFTDLSDEDMGILLEMAHSLPFVGNLESGDTYINVLTRNGESMVVAQYRHPDCDLYKRSIIGDIEKKEDEPAVYRDKTRVRQLEDEVASRVALIHEVHHRVKNNLQTIISLVGLESAHSKDARVKAFARTITAHVRSMNVTYELLSRTGSDHVSLKFLLEKICDNMQENRSQEECRIVTQIAGDDVWLMETTASTVALIVNELIQNSLKYAFPDREEGQIQMQIERGPRYSWVTVCDDGCGFDNKKVSTSSSGLGLCLINSLVRSSLHGEIFTDSEHGGTRVRFSFRNQEETSQVTVHG